jgi:hypothetical protein
MLVKRIIIKLNIHNQIKNECFNFGNCQYKKNNNL